MSRERVLTDKHWAQIEPLMPSSEGQKSRPFRDHRPPDHAMGRSRGGMSTKIHKLATAQADRW
jgi:transposase